MMRKRITMETSKGCLGNLEHHEDFDPDEDQNGIDLYKGLDVYIEPLSERKPVTKEYSESKSVADNNNKKNNDEEEKEKRNDISKGTEEAGREQKEDEEDEQDDLNNEHEFEKLTGDNREVAVSMEVDETENEKEKQTENMKDKEADKQKVNDGNENEKDKQDEFMNKQYDLTESECE
ncbi:hypothetical protein Tco_0908126 [Tanacetum coccineum]|uniref:Uncharacterized protein n=1 Tax=Tanacetum coccineum TaxID=301880 RepID=A0ABQ5CL89_9ASTR